MSLLITRPDYDPTTRYLSCWGGEIIKIAKSKGKKVIDLKGTKVTKKEFSSRMKKIKPSFVVMNGHGNEETITGQDDEVLVKSGENEGILHSCVTYAVSCSCGEKLGHKSVEKGNSTFIGYDDTFVFTLDQRYLSQPLKDKMSYPFMEASNHVAVTLLKGHTAIDASNRSKEIFKRNCRQLLSSKADFDSLQSARCLWWDMVHQVCLGNTEAKI